MTILRVKVNPIIRVFWCHSRLVSGKGMCCGYLLESPLRLNFNLYPQLMILWRKVHKYPGISFQNQPLVSPILLKCISLGHHGKSDPDVHLTYKCSKMGKIWVRNQNDKNGKLSIYLHKIICCGCVYESPHRGDYNTHPKHFIENL